MAVMIISVVSPSISSSVTGLRLIAPNGGEIITADATYHIIWTAPADAEKFILKYSMDNGMTWHLIVDDVSGTSYPWSVPVPSGNIKRCLVKVIAFNPARIKLGADRSDAPFTIEAVKLNTPNGEEELKPGQPYEITWTAHGTASTAAKVQLSYTVNGGLVWKSIPMGNDKSNDGSFFWTIPDAIKPKPNCKVKIVVKDDSGNKVGSDASNSFFSIQPAQKFSMRFKPFHYIDEQGIGIKAFSMLIPSDWSFEGGIQWIFDNPGAPAVASFRVRSPAGDAELQLLPAQSFFSTEDPWVLLYFPVGSRYYGNEVRPYPALGPAETLRQIVIPRFRGSVTNLQIISEQSMPEVGEMLRAGLPAQPNTTIEAAKIRIEYEQNGKLLEEEIYCVVESLNVLTYSPFLFRYVNNTFWMADFLFSFKGDKGSLDSHYKLFQTMLYSFRVNPQWFNKYVQLIDYLVQQQLTIIEGYGHLSQIISQTSDEISDMVWQTYDNRNAASDRMAEDFSNYILGTDRYFDPLQQTTVKLPSGYDYAWTNSLGYYDLSNDANYDPNIGSQQNWQRLVLCSPLYCGEP
jgi:hypothetical protein